MIRPTDKIVVRTSVLLLALVAIVSTITPSMSQVTVTASGPPDIAEIEQIVVTAQRRSELAQDVPIAITAITPHDLEKAGIVNYSDIQTLTPSLHFAITGGSEIPYIRGVGTGTTQSGQELGTALYIDDVYVSSPQASDMYLNNVAGITVLSGPQGTLFGRNATAGVVQISTKVPTQTPTFDANMGYGNYGTYEGSLYVSGPVSDRISADLAIGGNDQTRGWGRNEYNGQDVYESSGYAVRTRWEVAVADQTHITAIAGYSQFRTDEGYASHQLTPGQFRQYESYGTGVSSQGFYDVDLTGQNFSSTDVYTASIKIIQGLGFADLKSITSYSNLYNDAKVDYSLDAAPTAIQLFLPATQETTTEELQLVSTDAPGALFHWVTGLYLYRDRSGYHPLTEVVPGANVIYNSNMNTHSWAPYAQGTIALARDTNLALGVRYTKDSRDIYETEKVSIGGATPFNAGVWSGSVGYPGTTYTVNMDHHFTDKFMAYVGYTTGWKSGFFNTQVPQLVPGSTTEELPVKPETVKSVEGGFKSEFLDNRLLFNVSAFDYRYKDMQVNAFINTTTRDTLNAGAARIYGVDLDAKWKVLPQLTLSLGSEALHARFVDFANAPFFTPNGLAAPGLTISIGNAAGNSLPVAPDFTSTLGFEYEFDVAGGKLDVSGSAYYTSNFFWDVQNRLPQPSYVLYNSEIKWTAPGGHYNVALWGKNLSNVRYDQEITALVFGDGGYPAAPLTFGIRASVKF